MTTALHRRPTRLSGAPLVLTVTCSAAALGVLIGFDERIAVGALGAAALAVCCFASPTAGLLCFLPAVFVPYSAAGNALFKAGFVLCVAAWTLDAIRRGSIMDERIREFRRLIVLLVAMYSWFGATVLWADDPAAVAAECWPWAIALTVFVLVLTRITTTRRLLLLVATFVASATLAAATGLVALQSTASAFADPLTSADNRVSGAAGDPNVLGAGLVAAAILAFGLACVVRRAWVRSAIGAAILTLAATAAGTASRMVVISAGVALAAALVIFKQVIGRVLAAAVCVAASAALWFSLFPAAWQRLVISSDGGSGREDLWRAALRLALENPIVGLGLAGFQAHKPAVALEIGEVQNASVVAEQPLVAHNTYLQIWADTGVIGLVLFLTVVVFCIWCSLRAGRDFTAAGRRDLAALSRCVAVAVISMLGSAAFLSMARDYRLWFLLAIGPVLLSLARAESPWRRGHRTDLMPVAGSCPAS
ncbi:O-antigen ligase family protein [Paractinoplanes lichenicola]|uniref:O-antigen ligase family protein n=1 Tax=Paractinoplanes lichenicola TaxID=2802976 RepID=A0ABS1W6G7_9ACTN|nr:O-antigen ligase family protein [Actinoplanes lichenicola]MBL7262307.1 O-antigen ligase family protein [Actinoplanes lichenicola]